MNLSSSAIGAALRASGLSGEQQAEAGRRIIINAPLINIEGSFVADENSLNEMAEEMDVRLHRLAQLETGA